MEEDIEDSETNDIEEKNELDEIETSDHDTSSEQDFEDTNDEEEEGHSKKYFWGKDGTKWRKEIPPRNIRTRSINIISHLPGSTKQAKNAKSAADSFALFMTDTILNCVVHCTNIYMKSIQENFSRSKDAKETNLEEMKAVLGLLVLAGVTKSRSLKLENLWDRTKLGIPVFNATMSITRFRFLLRCMRFDDINDRVERKELDNVAPIREIFEIFVANCQNNYSLGEYVTIDEQLLSFRGKCKFRMYIPNKPAKYGIKVFALCDARTWYTSNLEIYAGKQPDGPYKISNSGYDVVNRLASQIEGSRRNITMDNWFTSIPLAETLLEKKITVIGTLRSNKREIPLQFRKFTKRELYSSIFAFRENMTLVSYASKKNKNVLALSTMHYGNDIDPSSGEQKKPDIITLYNVTKGGVDKVDEMVGRYTVARKTRRWPLRIFFHVVDTAALCKR